MQTGVTLRYHSLIYKEFEENPMTGTKNNTDGFGRTLAAADRNYRSVHSLPHKFFWKLMAEIKILSGPTKYVPYIANIIFSWM